MTTVRIQQNWICPYCGHAQVLADERVAQSWHAQRVSGWEMEGQPAVLVACIVCANQECKKLTLWAELGLYPGERSKVRRLGEGWKLLPPSSAKPQPEFIPKPLVEDYKEACAIRDLSPKASATLIRRCIQGMIRDFCDISKNRLVDEIDELRDRVRAGKAPSGVQPDSVEAIDQVRGIGNIGAHMEADINVIVDVDPDEAQILIQLTELLFREWYVARKTRADGLEKIKALAAAKKEQRQAIPTQAQGNDVKT